MKIEIPSFLSHLPIDDKGYPIPYFVAIEDSKPNYKILDEKKQKICIEHNKCTICGNQLLKKTFFFISGPMGVANRITTEPPMHRECAEYSLATCPHMHFANDRKLVGKYIPIPEVKCSDCNWLGTKDNLLMPEKEHFAHCPQCNGKNITELPKNDKLIPLMPDALYLVRSNGFKFTINPGGKGKLLHYKYDQVEEYYYKDGILQKTGEISKETK